MNPHHILLLLPLISLGLAGCYVDNYHRPLLVDPANGVHVDVLENSAETRSLKTPLASLVATRNGTVWDVTVISLYPEESTGRDAHLHDFYRTARTHRFTANDGQPHRITPVYGGTVTLAYSRTGWSTSEILITETSTRGDIVHSVTLK